MLNKLCEQEKFVLFNNVTLLIHRYYILGTLTLFKCPKMYINESDWNPDSIWPDPKHLKGL